MNGPCGKSHVLSLGMSETQFPPIIQLNSIKIHVSSLVCSSNKERSRYAFPVYSTHIPVPVPYRYRICTGCTGCIGFAQTHRVKQARTKSKLFVALPPPEAGYSRSSWPHFH
eukprot:1159865-Pelagomonas_calceolata.AAC.5